MADREAISIEQRLQPEIQADQDAALDLIAKSRRQEIETEYLVARRDELAEIETSMRELQSILSASDLHAIEGDESP